MFVGDIMPSNLPFRYLLMNALMLYSSPCVCVCGVSLQELELQFEKERTSLEEQKTILRQQLDELRAELTAKLSAANNEVVLLPFWVLCFGWSEHLMVLTFVYTLNYSGRL